MNAKFVTNITAPIQSVTNTLTVAHNRCRGIKHKILLHTLVATSECASNKQSMTCVVDLLYAHLPSSNAWDDENEGEGDHSKSHKDTHFQYIAGKWGLHGRVDDRRWLRTERISHVCSSSLCCALLQEGCEDKSRRKAAGTKMSN